MNYELFENEKEKAEARKALDKFTESPAWNLIEKALEANALYFEDELRDRLRDGSFNSTYQAEALQKRIDDIRNFKDLPLKLLLSAQPEEDEVPEETIYETPATEAGT